MKNSLPGKTGNPNARDSVPQQGPPDLPPVHEEAARRPRRITVPWIAEAPHRGDKIVMVTAYDYRQARIADTSDVDVVLVGDSLAMVVLGHDDTLSVSMEEMLHHTRAVRRGLERSLLVADMPYGSFHGTPDAVVDNGLRFVKEAGAQAVKIEGPRAQAIEALVSAEIPVMAHLGLTPQSLHKLGSYRVQGRGREARERMVGDALALQEAGAFALVLECVPSALAAAITERLEIPTIGIGAGVHCDGQVLVYHDLLGLEDRLHPKFVRQYANLGETARGALEAFARDVRAGAFPSEYEAFADLERDPSLRRVYG